MLKRHLGNEHQLTPVDYRARYNLPRDYPLVGPDYAKTRSKFGEADRAWPQRTSVGAPQEAALKARRATHRNGWPTQSRALTDFIALSMKCGRGAQVTFQGFRKRSLPSLANCEACRRVYRAHTYG